MEELRGHGLVGNELYFSEGRALDCTLAGRT